MRRKSIGDAALPKSYDVECRVKAQKTIQGAAKEFTARVPVLLLSDLLNWMYVHHRPVITN